jgi:hypothetical protein
MAADLNAWLLVWQSRRSRLAVSENGNGMRWFAHIQIGHSDRAASDRGLQRR